jgi:hypothetical protein
MSRLLEAVCALTVGVLVALLVWGRRRQAGRASRSCGRGAPLAFSGYGCC